MKKLTLIALVSITILTALSALASFMPTTEDYLPLAKILIGNS